MSTTINTSSFAASHESAGVIRLPMQYYAYCLCLGARRPTDYMYVFACVRMCLPIHHVEHVTRAIWFRVAFGTFVELVAVSATSCSKCAPARRVLRIHGTSQGMATRRRTLAAHSMSRMWSHPHPPEGAVAGDILADFLVTMLLEGKLSAKSLCTIAYWSKRAGAKGKIEEYSHNPADASTRHFMRTIDKANGIKVKDMAASMYYVQVPGLAKHDLSRTSHSMPVQAPHEAIE